MQSSTEYVSLFVGICAHSPVLGSNRLEWPEVQGMGRWVEPIMKAK